MKPIRVFRHIENEGPGYLAEVFERKGYPYEVIKIDQGEKVPVEVDTVAGLVFMGGSMSVNDPLPWIVDELDLIRLARSRQIPVLGHCLGGQLIAKAFGATVAANPVKEFGWHPVETVNTAKYHWLTQFPGTFDVFHWHGETFSLPVGADLILTNSFCTHQGFMLDDRILGLQCHIEMTEELVRSWVKEGASDLATPDQEVSSPSIQSAGEILSRLPERVKALQQMADLFYADWLVKLAL